VARRDGNGDCGGLTTRQIASAIQQIEQKRPASVARRRDGFDSRARQYRIVRLKPGDKMVTLLQGASAPGPARDQKTSSPADEFCPSRRTSGDVMPPEGAGDSAMEYYCNAAIEKKLWQTDSLACD
jgi:hypothetical protein